MARGAEIRACVCGESCTRASSSRPVTRPRLPLICLGLACLPLASSACNLASEALDDGDTQHLFRGAEVSETIAADPDALFFVDLREGALYAFDQVSPEAFAHFIVQCPSMVQPLPMEDFAANMELDLALPQWSIESSEPSFRSDHCRERCDANGTDCILVCDDLSALGG